jgi:predicted DNA-binding transcriptional regulator YafY
VEVVDGHAIIVRRMRASRLLSILLLLQTRGRMTAEELSAELEVSVRTIYRDMESLGAAGVPLYGDRGPDGGYRLVGGYRTRLTGLSGEEAESLFFAGMPGPAAELGLATALAAAQLKLLAALPAELRSRAASIGERFLLDAPAWFREAETTPHLAAVADAVWNQRPVRVRYRRWGDGDEPVERTLEPLGLVLKAGVWYVVAGVSEQARTYRVSQIRALEALPGRFERPEAFDLPGYWRAWSERFEANLTRVHAAVRLSPRAFERLAMFGQHAARAARESASRPDADGWREVTLPVESLEHGVVELLRLGGEAEVVGPAELRRLMGEAAEALARRYAVGPRGG